MGIMRLLLPLLLAGTSIAAGQDGETLPALKDGQTPQTLTEMWAGFDPCAEPLEVEVLAESEEDGVVLKVLRYRIGVFKGQKAMMAAVYGHPKGAAKVPGLVQIHGGGQSGHYNACLTNAKRGYATISLAWAGRISSPGHTVGKNGVQLFWDGKTDDRGYLPLPGIRNSIGRQSYAHALIGSWFSLRFPLFTRFAGSR